MGKRFKKILISRTDSIGDVCLTLPMVGAIKQHHPEADILFLGRNYTRDVIACCGHITGVLSWDDGQNDPVGFLKSQQADAIILAYPDKAVCRAAQAAGIPLRIATAGRFHTWMTCNKRVFFSRKNSPLHESQLNFRLLAPLNIDMLPDLEAMHLLVDWKNPAPGLHESISGEGPRVILHPKSKGSAPEWALEDFVRLAGMLVMAGARVFISGTAEEGRAMGSAFDEMSGVQNLCGTMTLSEFVGFIAQCDALVAGSTGPLHLAGLCGIRAVGLFSPQPPVHPGRWQPIGRDVRILTAATAPIPGGTLDISPDEVVKHVLAD